MLEAKSLNLNYYTINEFANQIGRDTHIKEVFYIDEIVKSFGGKINFIEDYDDSHNFINILGKNNFEINLLNGLDLEFKRLLLIQSIGHYLIHGNSGLTSCFIKKPQDNNGQYGFIFSLSLLIQDFDFLKLMDKPDNYLASIFRVPEFAIKIKKSLLKKYYKEEKYEKVS